MITKEAFNNLVITNRILGADGRAYVVDEILFHYNKTAGIFPVGSCKATPGLVIKTESGGFSQIIFWSTTEDCIVDENGTSIDLFNNQQASCN